MPSPEVSSSHVLLIPSFDTGDLVLETVREALAHWQPVWVLVDGSGDGSGEKLEAMAEEHRNLRVLRFARNRGKGAVLLDGFREAAELGFSHAVTMDADGQHPAGSIGGLVACSRENPQALVLGKPVFDETAPALRVHGRKISNFFAALQSLGAGIGDSLFGMRVYPVRDIIEVMESTRFARRFDFEPEVAVRLSWQHIDVINVDVPVRYLTTEEGGVSHFRYLRDNLLLAWMNLRLLLEWMWRLPALVRGRRLNKALRNPDSEVSVERAIGRVAGRFPRHWFRRYARSKMRSDPVFESVLAEMRGLDGDILDLGCGQGVLAFYLKERGLRRRVRGIDHDAARIKAAQKLAERYYEGMHFELGDVLDTVQDFSGHVVISDVLQYLSKEDQQWLVRKAARYLPPGGRLLIRTSIRDGSMRFRWQRIADLLARLVRWIPAKTRHYPAREELMEWASNHDLHLQGQMRRQWGRSLLNLHLAVFVREPADALVRPVGGDGGE